MLTLQIKKNPNVSILITVMHWCTYEAVIIIYPKTLTAMRVWQKDKTALNLQQFYLEQWTLCFRVAYLYIHQYYFCRGFYHAPLVHTFIMNIYNWCQIHSHILHDEKQTRHFTNRRGGHFIHRRWWGCSNISNYTDD